MRNAPPHSIRQSERAWIAVAAASILGLTFWSALTGGVVSVLYRATLNGEFVAALRGYILGLGPVGAIAYVVVVALEVIITPIPAALIYAPGGAIFGGFWGGTLSLLGNVIGAVVACFIGRAFGEEWLARKSPTGALARIKHVLQQNDIRVLFLLRLNPLTTTDLISYAAGVAGIPPLRVAAATAFGLAPMCYLQSYLAEAFLELVPTWAILVFGLALIATIVVMIRKS